MWKVDKMTYRRLRDLREDKDLTQKDIANILNISQRGYSHYETGNNDIPTEILIRLADFYDTSVNYLLGRTNNKNKKEKVKLGE